MKWLFHFILSHSIFLAFCAAALTLQTLQLLSLPINGLLPAFSFFAALLGYNAYWMLSRFSFTRPASFISFLQKTRSSCFVMLAAFIGMVFCMIKLYLVMYIMIITFILFIIYSLPVMAFKQLHLTRKAGFLKTILLAFTWAIVTALIPLQISIPQMGHAATLVFINRFLFMLMLCIIFDKRDAAIDKIRGLKSLATDIRPLWLHYLVAFIFISYTGISYSMNAYEFTPPQVAALIVTGLITVCIYINSLQKKGYLFYYFIVDGLMFLSALLTALASI